MEVSIFLLLFLLGASLGSYLNVCTIRIPCHYSTAWPPSHCMSCGWKIPPYFNIPIFSYLLLRGHCHKCKTSFTHHYIYIELLMGLLTLGVYLHQPFLTPEFSLVHFLKFAQLSLFVFFLLTITLIDLKHMIIPDVLSFSAIGAGILFSYFIEGSPFPALVGALVGAGIIYSIIYGYYFLTKVWGMGFGDAKLMGIIGANIGLIHLLPTLLYARILGSLIIGSILIITRKSRKTEFPFAPFLALGACISYFLDPFLFNFAKGISFFISTWFKL